MFSSTASNLLTEPNRILLDRSIVTRIAGSNTPSPNNVKALPVNLRQAGPLPSFAAVMTPPAAIDALARLKTPLAGNVLAYN